MNLGENSPHEIEHEEQESPLQTLNLLEDIEEDVQMPDPAALASRNNYRTHSGMRVLRTSPIILVFCGIVFASLIFLLDLKAQTDTHVEQTNASPAVSNSPAKNQTTAVSVREEQVQANVPVATPQPSSTPAALTPAPAPSPTPDSQNKAEELAGQHSAPAPVTPVSSDVETSGVEATSASTSADQGNYTLQVGSFNDLAEASERVGKLGLLGIKAYVARVEIPRRGTWYRVQTGSFASREEAARYGTQLRNKGSVPDFIIAERRAT